MNTIDWLTGALVLITAYYAWRTQQIVREMRQARELSVRPILAIELKFLGPNFADVAIINVGAGPAFDVDLEIVAEPVAEADRERDVRSGERASSHPVEAMSSRRQPACTWRTWRANSAA